MLHPSKPASFKIAIAAMSAFLDTAIERVGTRIDRELLRSSLADALADIAMMGISSPGVAPTARGLD